MKMWWQAIKKRIWHIFRGDRYKEIAPDEIFLDSSNLPNFDTSQLEGRLEKPISKITITVLYGVFLLLFVIAAGKTWTLQVLEGEAFAIQSADNRLRHSLLFSERGVIYDRNGVELAWNTASSSDEFARRKYIKKPGFSHVLGYVTYPHKDDAGFYYQTEYIGTDGAERSLNGILSGENGVKVVEINALDIVQSESVITLPQDGRNVELSIDARIQERLYELIGETARRSGFFAGAGVIMNIATGEIIAMASYPEFDSNVLAEGAPAGTIADYVRDTRKPFLNRVTNGLYTPGSIVKPYVAIGALVEGIIKPEEKILSTGSISIPNPFFPDQPSIFRDWKEHGWLTMKEAIGDSSNVYFFKIGGGYEERSGLGILNIEKYVRLFGLGEYTNIDLPSEERGVIPNPAWKAEHFEGDQWRIGDTYNTAIGQYGFQVTPLQMVRAVSAIANGGILIEPIIHQGASTQKIKLDIKEEHFKVVQEGMRYAVTGGTAAGLWFPQFHIAAKTGTAEVGLKKFICKFMDNRILSE